MLARSDRWLAGSLLSGAALFATTTARAEIVEIGPTDDLIAAIQALQPGDELVLQGGTYELTPKLTIAVSGTEDAPIVIRAKDGEVPIITRPDANQNTINIEGAQHVVLRGLEVVGGSHGIRMSAASFVTIEDCHIHDTGDVALSANVTGSSYQRLRILRNHIHDTNDTGEGMYLGCNANGCQVSESVIEGNYIHHTNGPTVVQGDGIELKEGSWGNSIRDNVIHDTNYPCILTYSTVGNGAPNVVERNVMWGCGDHGIQAAADAIIRNNIVLSANADGIRNQVHQSGAPSNLVITHNTVLKADGNAFRASDVAGSLLVANNAFYAQNGYALLVEGDLGQVVSSGNMGIGASSIATGFVGSGDIAIDFVGATFAGAPPNDPFPAPGSLLIAGGDLMHVADDDFNGTLREGVADVGAYKFDAAGNPGWVLGPGFKDPALSSGGAGGAGSGGATGAGGAVGAGGGSNGTGAGASGGASGAGAGEDDSGCDCRAVGGRAPSTGAAWGALLMALAWARRRRLAARPSTPR
jgi:MYXO-CTERM domain-containing protein